MNNVTVAATRTPNAVHAALPKFGDTGRANRVRWPRERRRPARQRFVHRPVKIARQGASRLDVSAARTLG
jgi:succinylarginine dihydrolase